MASVESTSIPSRPYYAPEDPALPKPWKGLVDGSTGLLYYWNIETNVTQYEKPAPLPPKPLREAPSVPMPTLPASPSAQSGGMLSQNGQQVMQSQAQYASYMNQQHGNALQFHSSAVQQPYFTQPSPQVHPYATANISQHNSQSGLSVSSGQHILQSLGQKNSEQNSHQFPQIPLQHGQHTLDDGSQKISHLQGSQLTYPQGHPYALQQSQHALEEGTQQVSHPHRSQMTHTAGHPNVQPVMNYMSYQQGVLPQDSSNSQPSLPISSNNVAHLHPQQSHQEQVDHQKGPRIHISQIPPQQLQQSAISHAPSNFNQMPQMGSQPDPVYSLGQSSRTVQQPTSSTQLNLPANDTGTVQTQTFPRFHNQITFSGHGHSLPPFSTNVGLQDNMHRRPGNELYAKAIDDRTAVQSQHPKLAAIPLARNRSDVRMDSRPCAVSPGAMVGPFPGHVSYNAYPDQTAKKASAFVTPGSFPNNTHAILGSIGSAASLSSTEAYCQQHEIMTMGENVPAPLMTFESTGFPPEIMREIHNAGFSSPTPIQAQTWPIALQNRDIVAVAKTGSGKTLGYLIPSFMLLRFRRNNPAHGPTVLVLAPTRELATQIQDEVFKFGRSSRVSCTCLYGGSPKGPQIRELDRGVDIVVATPGRLNDILDMRKINLTQVSLLVLDEADRMLDMGFEPQIRKVVNALPRRRQTLMYTATWPKEVRKIATDLLANPVQVNIGSADELAANKAITQYVEVVQQTEKQRRLEQILRAQERGSRTIVFCSTKRQCDYLVRGIGRTYGAAAIHGDKSQDERDFALGQFRTGRFPVLVATDVAARGLDVKDIRVVINYDFPSGIEDYVHRIGRTGRAGASGISFTFFSDQDAKYAADLIRVLEGANQRVPPDVRALAARAADAAAGRFGDPRWSAGGGAVRGGGYAFRRGAGTVTGFRGRGGRGSDRGGGRFSRRSYSRSPQRYGRSYSRSSTSSGGSQRRSRSPGRTRTSRSPNRARVVVGLENGRGGDDVIRDDDGGSREPVKAPSPTEVALPPPVTVDLPTKTD